MKTLSFAFALLCAFAATVLPARADYSEIETITETKPFSATGKLQLKNVNGSVEVRSWDRNEIKVECEKSARTAEELKLIQLTMDLTPARAAIEVKLPKRAGTWFGESEIRAAVKFVITVPATAELSEVRTINGAVKVTGVRGKVNAGSVNGRVSGDNLAGSIKLSTVNGGVDARLVSVASSDHLEFATVNGGVTVKLPSDIAATLNASTVNGGVDCDFPVEVSGRFTGRRVRGTINNGTAEIKATTVNGGVRIQRI